ncbi:TetR/AcrR family transcriptional regulator [Nocardia sp. NPDC057227]|uniref:TetR/AcrR family transcriptional regulator n=1 Tax=Nocardia sp. NPDC057227 TaxID=3346056 RepID=UPI003630C8EE
MPRLADHDLRRRQIAEAVWRLAARGGLEQVTLRQVAAEAGVSVRLLQYYFGTRDQMLLGALEILNADAEATAKERLAALGPDPGLRAVVRGVVLEMLPLDEERRSRHTVYAAYFVRFLTEPALAAVARDAPPALTALLTELLTHSVARGEAEARIDAGAEAALLLAAADGLQYRVLLGQLPAAEAVALLDRQLDRIFTSGS